MKILVISPCSKEQTPDICCKLQLKDFNSCDLLAQGIERLKKHKKPAAKLYVGKEHKQIMKGLEKIRKCYGREAIDLSIISTGYGLVCESECIVPYDVPIKHSPVLLKKEKRDKLHKDIETLIANGGYNLVFFLLSGDYYEALELCKRAFNKRNVPDTVTLVFLVGESYSHLIPCLRNYHPVLLNFDEFGGRYIAKGQVFKKLCKIGCKKGFDVFEKVVDDPQQIPDIVSRACNEK